MTDQTPTQRVIERSTIHVQSVSGRPLPPWEEDHAELVRLARQRLSAAQIGRKLGRTRNAVIGRCYREGVRLYGGAFWLGDAG